VPKWKFADVVRAGRFQRTPGTLTPPPKVEVDHYAPPPKVRPGRRTASAPYVSKASRFGNFIAKRK
jgi:hypothetical protein